MTLAMIILRSSVDMVKVCSEDLDCAETRAIGWTLSVLAIVAIEIETTEFVTMIASLNIVAKTFAKIAKTFVGLLVAVIAIRRRYVLILHLEKKNMQKWIAKMKSTQKIR